SPAGQAPRTRRRRSPPSRCTGAPSRGSASPRTAPSRASRTRGCATSGAAAPRALPLRDHGDRIADANLVALDREDRLEHAVDRRLDLLRRLLGLDLDDHLAGADPVALALQPACDRSVLLLLGDALELHLDGHGRRSYTTSVVASSRPRTQSISPPAPTSSRMNGGSGGTANAAPSTSRLPVSRSIA